MKLLRICYKGNSAIEILLESLGFGPIQPTLSED